MTRGWPAGPSGRERRALVLGAGLAAGIVTLIIGINILTRLHDRPHQAGQTLIDELSSLLTVLPALAIAAATGVWIRRRRPSPWRIAAVLLAGFAVFVAVHVGGFVVLRKAAYAALADARYDFGPWAIQLPYEALKDGLGYPLAVVIFWRLLGPAFAEPQPAAATPAVFHIQDGSRWVRVPLVEILAVRSAGNYVEFLLADGRRPLMRTPLTGLEERLKPRGFVRTHRSWLVNAGQVRGVRPEGSGDHTIELGPVEAPLSRRYRDALVALRGLVVSA